MPALRKPQIRLPCNRVTLQENITNSDLFAKRKNKDAIIVVMGCYSQIKPEDIDADIVIGNKDKSLIVSYIEEYLERIFNTWKITPKIHFSSPKNLTKKDFRSHNDYINVNDFLTTVYSTKYVNYGDAYREGI